MWPFASKRFRVEDVVGPTPVDVVARVASPNEVTSPISGLQAAFVRLEILELVSGRRHGEVTDLPDEHVSLGTVLFGDLVLLELEGGVAVEVVVRRAELRLLGPLGGAVPVVAPLPEIVPFLARARRSDGLCQHEYRVLCGDRLRLRAVVERVSSVVSPYRPAVTARLVVRDDVAPVVLDEVLPDSGF